MAKLVRKGVLLTVGRLKRGSDIFAGADIQLTLKKGSISHDCDPACELHRLASEGQKGPSGSWIISFQGSLLDVLAVGAALEW